MKTAGVKTGRLLAAIAVLALAALAPVGDGHAQDAQRHGIFLDTLDVDLVNVEVVATHDGEPVNDLTRDDFEVFDDGEPVEITNFYIIAGGRRVDFGAPGSVLPSVAQPLERSNLVVLVDETFVGLPSRKHVLESLLPKLVDLMGQGTRVLVARKDFQVEIVQPFTSDIAEVETAVHSLLERGGAASMSDLRERQILRAVSIGALPGTLVGTRQEDQGELDASDTFQRARQHALEQLQLVRRSVRVMRTFLDSLAGVPGHKALLYVSDGLPRHPGQEVFDAWYGKYGFDYGDQLGVFSVQDVASDFDADQDIREMIADASANGVAIYPVGWGRRGTNRGLSAEVRNAVVASGIGFRSEAVPDRAEGLERLAAGTGGRTSIDRVDVDRLFSDLERDLRNRYSLGFPSPHRADGKTHELEVRVKRPGVQLRYPRTYRDKGPDRQMEDRTLAALLHGTAANPLDVRILIGDVEKAAKGKTYAVPIEVRWPIANLVLLPGESSHRGSVSVFIVARDDQGRLSDPAKVVVPIEIPNDGLLEAVAQLASYRTKVMVREGEQTLAVGLRDDVGGRDATVRIDVQAGKSG